jgi:hypothetical protein
MAGENRRMSQIATALASADKAEPELAADVVRAALERAGIGIARSVLLSLTDFIHQAHVLATHAALPVVTGCGAGVHRGRRVRPPYRLRHGLQQQQTGSTPKRTLFSAWPHRTPSPAIGWRAADQLWPAETNNSAHGTGALVPRQDGR